MIIKKIDISSIFPIIIKIIKLNLDVVSKLAKFISSIPNIDEVAVFVIVSIESLKDFSKFTLSAIRIPDKINKLIKKDIKIKKDILIFSSVIFFSVLKIVLLIILFGLINLTISEDVDLMSTYILVNFMPEVFETNDPPSDAININNRLRLFSVSSSDKPELLKLLRTFIIA